MYRQTEGKEDAINVEFPVHDYVKTYIPSAPILVLPEKKYEVFWNVWITTLKNVEIFLRYVIYEPFAKRLIGAGWKKGILKYIIPFWRSCDDV